MPNGVDSERFRPPRDAGERAAARDAAGLDGELAILTVGGIEPRKGSLTLLRAFAAARQALPERRPVLLVAGGATLFDHRDEIDRFHALRDDLDLGDSRARARPRDRRRARAASTAPPTSSRCPSTKEGFGLAVLEALAAGLPAVVSDLDVFRTYLADGDSALMAPVGDHAALADALVRAAVTTRARGAVARRRAGRGGAPRLGRGRGAPTRRPTRASWRWRGADGARGRGHVAGRPRHRRRGRASTRSASTSPLTSGGGDSGMMPTELFCAALASCFCLAVGLRRRQARPGGAGPAR